MGIAHSTYYKISAGNVDAAALLAAIVAVCDECESYGWHCARAVLHQQGPVASHQRIRHLMRDYGLQSKARRRFVAATDRDRDSPIFPDCSKDMVLDGRDQLWVADLTSVDIPNGFACVAIILDTCSCRVVGYAFGRSIAARLALAALRAAMALPDRLRVASTIPTADRNTPRRSIADYWPMMSMSVRWDVVAIRTTT